MTVDRATRSRALKFTAASFAGLVALGILALGIHSSSRHSVSPVRTGAAMAPVRRQFAMLSSASSDVCQDLGNVSAIESYVNALPGGSSMQGSCCSAMDYNHYLDQVTALKAYADIAAIPGDPYDISKTQARQMLAFYDNIGLSTAQQSTFDATQSQTADHGWCCCQCWAWYTHAGLAKYLISQQGFSTQQVVHVIDLEDCCGGAP
ncbi:MAG: hypothetical protein ACYCUG_18005 [Acidimicrobiales bacterium]